MPVVHVDEYTFDKKDFFAKHHNRFECETKGSSAEYYQKTYTFDDGVKWYEAMRKIDTEAIAEIYYLKFKVPVELFQVEYWNSEDSYSKFYYELWDHRKAI